MESFILQVKMVIFMPYNKSTVGENHSKKNVKKKVSEETPREQRHIEIFKKLRRIPLGKQGILIGLLVLFFLILICAAIHPGNFFKNFPFYLLFFILWPVCTFLVWLALNFIKYLIWAAVAIPGALAILSYLGGSTEAAVVFGAISLGVLLVIVAIGLAIGALIVGPGILAGIGIYHALGGGFFGVFVGILVGIVLTGFIAFLAGKIILPFAIGFGITTIGGAIANEIANSAFRIHRFLLLKTNLEDVLRDVGRKADLGSLKDAIMSILSIFGDMLQGIWSTNWVIFIGAVGVGILFVVLALKEGEDNA
jgi:hypothetical protein